MTHTGRMNTPIRPGTARRLGLRRPGEWSDTMQRSTRPAWGASDCPTAWTERFGSEWPVTAGAVVTGPVLDGIPRDGSVVTAEQVRQRRNR